MDDIGDFGGRERKANQTNCPALVIQFCHTFTSITLNQLYILQSVLTPILKGLFEFLSSDNVTRMDTFFASGDGGFHIHT